MSCQNPLLLFIQNAFPADRFLVLHHHGKRFYRPVLQSSKPRHRFLGRSVAAQMKASDSLDRGDPSLFQDPAGFADRLRTFFRSSGQIDLGSAFIAAHGLSVVTARCRIIVFPFALRAHGKFFHGRPVPVIGQSIQDGQPRTAGSAVDKRMQISSV